MLLGCAYSGLLPPPAVIVNTSLVCDANNLSFRELSNFYGVPQYYVDVPPERSEASVTYVAEQLRDLAIFLENHTNRKLDPDRIQHMAFDGVSCHKIYSLEGMEIFCEQDMMIPTPVLLKPVHHVFS